MGSFAEDARRAKALMDTAIAAAMRGDWSCAERALREVQMGARELRLLMLSRSIEEQG